MEQNEFRNLALKELDAVYRLAHHLGGGAAGHADDLVQETYLHAFRSRTDFQLTTFGLRPYLFKILHNIVNTRLARANRQPSQSNDLDSEAFVAALDPNGGCNDLAGVDWESVDDRLKRAVDELPLAQRTVFLLCAVEGLRYREIAEIVSVPVGTVMSRLHTARHTLAARLTDLAAEQRLGSDQTTPNDESK